MYYIVHTNVLLLYYSSLRKYDDLGDSKLSRLATFVLIKLPSTPVVGG